MALGTLTLTADEDAIRMAKAKAHHAGKSLDGVLREWLENYVKEGVDEKAQEISDMILDFRSDLGGVRLTREEMNDHGR